MATTNSAAFRINVVEAGAEPTWRVGLDVNEWVELSGSAMSNFPPSVDPGRAAGGPSNKMDAWCGLCIDTRSNEVWSIANGGHNDYHGNEVCKFTLGDDSPEWVEVTPSDDAADFTVPSDTPRYSNGRPVSAHTYGLQAVIESRDRAIRFGVGSSATVGNPKAAVDGFDVLTTPGSDGWDASSTYPDVPNSGVTGMCAVKSDTAEDVYVLVTNTALYKWTNASNTWSSLGSPPSPVDGYYTTGAFDSTRGRIFYLGDGGSGNTRHTYTLSGGTWTQQTLSGSSITGNKHGMVYVPDIDAFLLRQDGDSGGTIYKIDASTFAVTTLSTTGGGSIVAPAGTGVYNRFLYAPSLGGVVYFPRYNSNAWFLRVH